MKEEYYPREKFSLLSEGISGHLAPMTTLSHAVLTLGIWEPLLLYCGGRCDGGVFEGLRAMLRGPEGRTRNQQVQRKGKPCLEGRNLVGPEFITLCYVDRICHPVLNTHPFLCPFLGS